MLEDGRTLSENLCLVREKNESGTPQMQRCVLERCYAATWEENRTRKYVSQRFWINTHFVLAVTLTSRPTFVPLHTSPPAPTLRSPLRADSILLRVIFPRQLWSDAVSHDVGIWGEREEGEQGSRALAPPPRRDHWHLATFVAFESTAAFPAFYTCGCSVTLAGNCLWRIGRFQGDSSL